jgi:hypothetical protein
VQLSLEMAIDQVEAGAARAQCAQVVPDTTSNARDHVAPSQPANQNGEARYSLATFWAGILRRTDGGTQVRSEPIHCEDGTDGGRTWLTELLARASHGGDNDEQDFTPRWTSTQNGGANQQRR